MRDAKLPNCSYSHGPFGVGGLMSVPILGLIMNMGLITLPDIKDYWSSERKIQIQFFGDMMFGDRLLQIFWMMHLGK
jgi:hypothetical protein